MPAIRASGDSAALTVSVLQYDLCVLSIPLDGWGWALHGKFL